MICRQGSFEPVMILSLASPCLSQIANEGHALLGETGRKPSRIASALSLKAPFGADYPYLRMASADG